MIMEGSFNDIFPALVAELSEEVTRVYFVGKWRRGDLSACEFRRVLKNSWLDQADVVVALWYQQYEFR